MHFLHFLSMQGRWEILQTFVPGHISVQVSVSTAHNGSALRSVQDDVTHVHVCSSACMPHKCLGCQGSF